MGQMTYGVMYGVRQNPPDHFEDGWWTLLDEHNDGPGPTADIPHGDGPEGFIGFWVAVGGSGEDGVPTLDEPFQLADMPECAEYAERLAAVKAAWPALAACALAQGVPLGIPALWLVQTETS